MAPTILLVVLESSMAFEVETNDNLLRLTQKYATEMVMDIPAFHKAIKATNIKVVILADHGLTLPANEETRERLYAFAKAGGLVMLAYEFGIMSRETDINAFFADIGLPMWSRADHRLDAFTRCNLGLNPAIGTFFGTQAIVNLKERYAVEGVHISGVEDKHKILVPFSADAGTIASIAGHDSATPSAVTPLGAGYVAFLGDFPLSFGTVRIMIALIEKALAAPTTTTNAPTPSLAHAGAAAQQKDNGKAGGREEEDEDEDFELAEGLEGLELDEDAFDKSWAE